MSVYKRGDAWYINITIKGVRINRRGGSTKKEAQTIESELKTKIRLNDLHVEEISNNDIIFDSVAEEYLETVKQGRAKRTHTLSMMEYNNHIKPFFSHYTLRDIGEKLFFDYQSLKKSKGYSNRTINIHVGIIRKIINFAVTQKYIKSIKLKYPRLKEPKKLLAFVTEEEYKLLIDNVMDEMAKLRIIFARNTGLRPAELTYLHWNDVVLEYKIVRIQAKSEWTPKTGDERVVYLNNTAINILQDLSSRRSSSWVFSYTDTPVKSIKRALATASRRAGLNKMVTPYMLRHTFATHTLLRGGDLMSIKEQMGHSDIRTTERYLHAVVEHQRKTVELLDI
ncbi:MAG: tyrosine-type recombinase/integrase [Nitrospirae bacterium]|nr:tyrosine-type recombinase/integrase [Nitrospirota bacterium]